MPLRSPALRTARQRLHVEMLEQGVAQVLELAVYSQSTGALDAPSSGTWALYSAGSSTPTVSKVCTITSSIATASLSTSDTSSLSLGEGWEQVWSLTYTDGLMVHRSGVAVVKRRPYPVLTDADLYAEQPILQRVMATGDTTWIDTAETAWWTMLREMLSDGRRPWLVREPGALHDAHLALTLERIFRQLGASTRADTNYLQLADTYLSRYRSNMSRVRAEIDRNAEVGTEVNREPVRSPVVMCPVGRY